MALGSTSPGAKAARPPKQSLDQCCGLRDPSLGYVGSTLLRQRSWGVAAEVPLLWFLPPCASGHATMAELDIATGELNIATGELIGTWLQLLATGQLFALRPVTMP